MPAPARGPDANRVAAVGALQDDVGRREAEAGVDGDAEAEAQRGNDALASFAAADSLPLTEVIF